VIANKTSVDVNGCMGCFFLPSLTLWQDALEKGLDMKEMSKWRTEYVERRTEKGRVDLFLSESSANWIGVRLVVVKKGD
jgi:hypothetical protein